MENLLYKEVIKNISNIDRNSDEVFDFEPILNSIILLKEKVLKVILDTSDDDKFNLLVKRVGGRLNRLMYSSISEYEFDNTFPMNKKYSAGKQF